MIFVIKNLNVPKIILMNILMLTSLNDIQNVILNVKGMNIFNDHYKSFLSAAKKGFIENCKNGNLDVAKWIYYHGDIDHHAHNEYAFRIACRNGNLDVAQWIFSLGGVDYHAENEYAFRFACAQGYLKVAQWIFSLGGVNYHVIDDWAFRLACENGHLDVAQWIYSLGNIDYYAIYENHPSSRKFTHLHSSKMLYCMYNNIQYIDDNDIDDYSHKIICYNRKLEVVEWLLSLYKENNYDHASLRDSLKIYRWYYRIEKNIYDKYNNFVSKIYRWYYRIEKNIYDKYNNFVSKIRNVIYNNHNNRSNNTTVY